MRSTALCLLAAFALFGLPAAAQQVPAQASRKPGLILFTNVNVFDSANARLLSRMSVLVDGQRIAAVQAGVMTAPAGARVVDGGGRTLIPGLIDTHVHLFMGANTERQMLDTKGSPDVLHGRAAEEARKMLLRGFTTARDMGGPVFGLKRAIDQGKIAGPRIYPSGAMISQTSGHGDTRLPQERSRKYGGTVSRGELLGVNFIADGRPDVLTATRENLRGGAAQIKAMAGGGAATVYDPLDVTQYTLDELKAIVEAADDWGTYVTVHAYTPKAVRRAVEAGVKCIEHGQLLDEPSIQLLAEKGVWLSLQVLDEAPATATADVRRKKRTVIEGTDNAFKWAKKHNVKLSWGTDFLFNPLLNKNQNSDILKLKSWFTPAEALRLVTFNNGQLVALSGPRNPYPGKLGVIEPGAFADLILVEGDPTANLDILADPEKNFRVIMKDGEIHKNTL